MKRDKQSFGEYLEALLCKRNYPGMVVCIRGPEGVLFDRGFGYRSIEHHKKADTNTIFGIASMSKSMTALACCILQTEGKMNLDDPVVQYFPDFHIPGAADECVTVRTLAMHRAGIPPMEPLEWSIAMNSTERDSKWYREMVKTAPNRMDKISQIIDYISEGNYKPLGAPGEYMSYSNEGYAILSFIIDQAAGMPLETFLKERIFIPLGMNRTVLDLDGSEAKELARGNITSLFERDDQGKLIWDDHWSVLPPFRGCACVKSTARDMAKYYQMLAMGGSWEGKRIVPKEAVELLCGREFPLRKEPFYCLGLEKRLIEGKMVCEHSGGLHGVSTQGGFVEGGYSAVVLCNEGDVDVDEFQNACYNFIFGLPYDTAHDWAEPSGKVFRQQEMLCGTFMAREGMPSYCIVSENDGQLSAVYNEQKIVLLYDKCNIFIGYTADGSKRVNTFRFLIRDGSAWGVRCGTRIYQRTA